MVLSGIFNISTVVEVGFNLDRIFGVMVQFTYLQQISDEINLVAIATIFDISAVDGHFIHYFFIISDNQQFNRYSNARWFCIGKNAINDCDNGYLF